MDVRKRLSRGAMAVANAWSAPTQRRNCTLSDGEHLITRADAAVFDSVFLSYSSNVSVSGG